MRDRIKKIIIVVFLAIFIWAWAYNALEEKAPEKATLSISRMANPDLLVNFTNMDSLVSMEITFKGPRSKIAQLKKEIRNGERELNFDINVRSEKIDEPGHHVIQVLEFLNNSAMIELPGITVESCSIDEIGIDVEQLEMKKLEVQVIDENNFRIEHEEIKPSTVEMYVRKDSPDTLKANVKLSSEQIAKARLAAEAQRPYIKLGDEPRIAKDIVYVKLPPAEQALVPKTSPHSRIGFVREPGIEGKYTVKLLNEDELVSATKFRATEEAWTVYQAMPYHILIEIFPDDAKEAEVSRPIIYNFPHDYIERREIMAVDKPRTAKFTVKPVAQQ